jgi:hypothetical protein
VSRARYLAGELELRPIKGDGCVSPRAANTKLDRSDSCYGLNGLLSQDSSLPKGQQQLSKRISVRVGSMKAGGRIDVLLREMWNVRNGKSGEQWHGDERRTCLMDGAKARGFAVGRVRFRIRTRQPHWNL